MSKIIERVTSIKKDTVKTGKSIGKSYYRVTLGDGNTAFVWSWPIIRDIKIGDTCELVVEQKGQFLNITAAAPIRSTADEIPSDDDIDFEDEEAKDAVTKTNWEEEPMEEKVKVKIKEGEAPYRRPKLNMSNKDDYWQGKFEYDMVKDRNITRMSAVKAAVEYANYCKPIDAAKFKPLPEEDIILIADIFFNYFTTGKFVEVKE